MHQRADVSRSIIAAATDATEASCASGPTHTVFDEGEPMIPIQSSPNGEAQWSTTLVELGAARADAQAVESVRSRYKLLVTPEEAAEILSVGRTTVYDLMSNGQLESVQIKSCRRIPVAALEQFVQRLLERTQQRPR